MGRNYFLDKDALIDKNDNIFFVLTNYNPYGYVFAYLKYIYTGKGLWKGFDRNLRYYGIRNLLQSRQEFIYEPCFGASFPIKRLSEVKKHLTPEDKIDEIIRKSSTSELDEIILDLISKIDVKNIGITGSILLNIQHSKSDIDFVIYGDKDTEDFFNTFEGFDIDKDWILETSKNYNIPVELAKSLYNKKTRGIYKGIKYSILFVDNKPWQYCKDICIKEGPIKISGDIYGDVRALYYPSTAFLFSNKKTFKILSYEGIYNTVLYGNHKVEIYGMLMECNEDNTIIVGDREIGGYIRPYMQ
ncbi:nucleotidyltransferase domain-containing protein [Acidianus brierleyi]|uniref:Nucleotidyltransferase n=1 Tax=Acidianus brierleyi TaxID=41673 RepID=A0A2U9IE93_9CREN|nr:nucleotidyltransferase domain-containing protein [Acidianus brierleyi]AWR94363.1 nucleotidyltransferase [Acidianus brierleyi]